MAGAAAGVPRQPARDLPPMTEPKHHDAAMEYDELSGRTIHHPGPWQEMLANRRQVKQQAYSPIMEPARSKPSRVPLAPRLPESDFKVIYRPRDGLRLASWSDRQITAGVQLASKIPERAFNQQVTVQVQAIQNLIVTSTPNEECAAALCKVTSILLGAATYNLQPYLKHFPGTVRGVIHGLDPGTTTEQLPYILASSGPRIVQARILGQSTSAVVTFEGPHVPFFIRAHGLHTRCRPYRRSIQCCTLCGDIGHRRDVCPTPEVTVCAQCHERDPSADHTCTPKCKLCGLAHLTASKECRKKLHPPPPPLHVRERLARTTVTYHRQPQQPAAASHPPPPTQVQDNARRQYHSSQQVSWSSVVAPEFVAPQDFPPLPSPKIPAPDNSPRIQQLEQENEQLRKQLEAQAARTEQLERRIEELLTHLQKITPAPAESTSQVTPASAVMQQPCVPPTPSDIGRLEKLIREIGQQMESRITAIEKRQEANETVRRKTRRKQKTPGPSNPPSTLPSDDDFEPCESGEL